MKTAKKILSVVLAMVIGLGSFALITSAETSEHLTEIPEGYVGVYTKEDLDNIKLDMSGKYILMNDIIFEDSDYEKGGSFYNSGKGWEPIGTKPTNFMGTFDGNGYKIKNLYINNPTQNYIGLFGYVCDATITKLSLQNANITGEDYVGGIVGYSYQSTTVSFCNVQGAINGTNYVGGVAGFCYTGSQDNYVMFCSNSSSVSASASNVGGIVGYIRSYNGYYVEIKNCYNMGDVSGKSYVGGVAGYCIHDYNTKVNHCYSIGAVIAKSSYGGCFGNPPRSYDFCYYLDETVTNPTNNYGTPKSEDQLKKQTTFEQWDFNSVWTMGGREDYPYPEIIGSYPVLPEDSIHKHEYTSEITTPATHTSTGVMTFTCECGESYTEIIDKIATHNYVVVVTEPTCTEKGYTTYICECNDTYIDDYVDAKGHDFESVFYDATCTEHGYTTFVCECGETYTRDYTNAKGHNFTSENTTPATHTTTGIMTFTCECGDTYTKEIDKIATHDFKTTVTAPTCTEQGYTTYTCECGETYTRDYANATGHNHTAVATAPTCTEQGYTTYTCECGDSYVDDYVDATGHSDTDNDGNCNDCVEHLCDHACHKSGFAGFFWKITCFFSKLFGTNKVCECGNAHY